jgi:hypothetical protein
VNILVLGICDFRHKTPRQRYLSLTPALQDRHGASKIPHSDRGPSFPRPKKKFLPAFEIPKLLFIF